MAQPAGALDEADGIAEPQPYEEALRDDRRAVERLCLATRKVRPVDRLLRFVPAPDGTLTPDLRRRLPGRGAWVTATRDAVADAVKRKAFARSLRRPVTVPADLLDTVEALMERAALDMLSMANKAGLVTAGHAKTVQCIEAGMAAAVVQAGDGAPDGARKLVAALRRAYIGRTSPPFLTMFTSGQLDLALGREHVVHAALGAGPACTGFLERVAALAVWRRGEASAEGPSGPDGQADDLVRETRQAPSMGEGADRTHEDAGHPAGTDTE